MSLNKLCQDKKVDIEVIRKIINEAKNKKEIIEEIDEHGVTPLQQAAFRGNLEVSRLLLEHGADVNSSRHTEGYTTLMFAALSGNTELIELVLDAGANPHSKNKVNRNAAEMASFVGLHDSAITIRSYFPKSVFDAYTKNFELKRQPALPSDLVVPLRRLIMRKNVHPVKIIFLLRESEGLRSKDVIGVLEHLSDKFFKVEHNDWLSGKIHFVKCVIQEVVRTDLETTLKRWMKARDIDGFKLNLDNFIRACVRSYKFHESDVFRQMVITLANSSQEPPITEDGALDLFLGSKPDNACYTCWDSPAGSRCTACKAVLYCDRACQKLDWGSHKRLCEPLRLSKQAEMAESDN